MASVSIPHRNAHHRFDLDGRVAEGEVRTIMGMPRDVGVIDTMLGFPHPDMKQAYRFITRQTKDDESREEFDFPVEYIFKDVPGKELTGSADPVSVTLTGDGSVGDREGTHRHRRSRRVGGRRPQTPSRPLHRLVQRRSQ